MYQETQRLSADFSAEYTGEREWHYIFKVMKGETYNQEYPAQQGVHSFNSENRSSANKSKLRVQHHQTSFTRKVKGMCLSGKEKTWLEIWKL